jgi:hypothetical protein
MRNVAKIAFMFVFLADALPNVSRAGEPASVVHFQEQAEADAQATQDSQENRASNGQLATAALGDQRKGAAESRYQYRNGRWWYLDRRNQWHWWNNSRWVPQQTGAAARGDAEAIPTGQDKADRAPVDQTRPPFASSRFDTWFNAYRGFPTGRAQLQTAEAGQVEMGTSDITEVEAAEAFEVGGIPRRQARRPRAGVGRTLSGGGSWFNAGSPFGIRYGYGSGFGYGGYGFDNPYGYGSRTGSGGAYGYGFGDYGSVGGQTGERLSSLISGTIEEGGRLVGPEPPGIGAPQRLETAVGGSYGKAGAGVRKLGASASESGGD